MKKYAILIVFVLALLLSGACGNVPTEPTGTAIALTPATLNITASTNTLVPNITFPTMTTRNVPAPAPIPWSNVKAYTEQTYQITVKVGDEFAIGMFATMNTKFDESHDTKYLEEVSEDLVKYDPTVIDKYGTDWFLYKAINVGSTEIIYRYPFEYTKVFKISIY